MKFRIYSQIRYVLAFHTNALDGLTTFSGEGTGSKVFNFQLRPDPFASELPGKLSEKDDFLS